MTSLTRHSSFLWFGFDIDVTGQHRKPVWLNVVILGVFLPITSAWALYRVATSPPSSAVWLTAAGLYVFTLFGVTLGNHRYWTHRGFKARRPLRLVMAFASALSMQGDIEQWARTHRAHHHYADRIGLDPHSPYEYREWAGLKGLAWAQGIWLLFERPESLQLAPAHDLSTDHLVQIQRKLFPWIAIGQFGVLLAFYPWFGLDMFLVSGALRVVALLTATGMVNSVCHRWGSRAVDSAGHVYRRDDSRNNLLVALVAGGEGNHAWHHADPVCPRHGRKVTVDPDAVARGVRPDRAWRPDATWRLIQVLAALHLVYDVRRPRTTMHFAPSQCQPRLETGDGSAVESRAARDLSLVP